MELGSIIIYILMSLLDKNIILSKNFIQTKLKLDPNTLQLTVNQAIVTPISFFSVF